MWDRLRWALRIGPPGPVEASAAAIASRELAEVDVDLPTWERARAGGEAGAHDRYVRLRVAALRRELRAGAAPLLAQDKIDRRQALDEMAARAEAFRQTPEGKAAFDRTLRAAISGLAWFSLLYAAAVGLILLLVWLAVR
ncbi:hypothetical protein [Rubrivirga sp. IMCC43871]|uniref:hypothetical protein n=1 Tax=Rubrivirga sp. IMCC43871 TaxID=3391575 RepID=UPI00398FE2C1